MPYIDATADVATSDSPASSVWQLSRLPSSVSSIRSGSEGSQNGGAPAASEPAGDNDPMLFPEYGVPVSPIPCSGPDQFIDHNQGTVIYDSPTSLFAPTSWGNLNSNVDDDATLMMSGALPAGMQPIRQDRQGSRLTSQQSEAATWVQASLIMVAALNSANEPGSHSDAIVSAAVDVAGELWEVSEGAVGRLEPEQKVALGTSMPTYMELSDFAKQSALREYTLDPAAFAVRFGTVGDAALTDALALRAGWMYLAASDWRVERERIRRNESAIRSGRTESGAAQR